MRYSIVDATPWQIEEVGARNVKYTRTGSIAFADLDDDQVAKLIALNCNVNEVVTVRSQQIAPPIPLPADPIWTPTEVKDHCGLEYVRALTSPMPYGEGFNIAVMGTGIRSTHEIINGRVVYAKNYTSSPGGDVFDHETGVAGIILSIAPQCNILDIKVIGDNGEGTDEDVTLAMDDLVDMYDTNHMYAPHVINMSFGCLDTGDPNSPMRIMCRQAIGRGIMLFASAGNDGPGASSITSPAVERDVFAVGSADMDTFQVSYFSSRGPTLEGLVKPDALMAGENLIVASSASDTATTAKSGTSFSCPFLAGLALMCRQGASAMWENPDTATAPGVIIGIPFLPPRVLIEEHLISVCTKPEGELAGKDNIYGYGCPNVPVALEKFGATPSEPVSELDMSGLLSAVVVMGMMGVMMKAMN